MKVREMVKKLHYTYHSVAYDRVGLHQMVIREPSGSDSRSIAKNSLQLTVYYRIQRI